MQSAWQLYVCNIQTQQAWQHRQSLLRSLVRVLLCMSSRWQFLCVHAVPCLLLLLGSAWLCNRGQAHGCSQTELLAHTLAIEQHNTDGAGWEARPPRHQLPFLLSRMSSRSFAVRKGEVASWVSSEAAGRVTRGCWLLAAYTSFLSSLCRAGSRADNSKINHAASSLILAYQPQPCNRYNSLLHQGRRCRQYIGLADMHRLHCKYC